MKSRAGTWAGDRRGTLLRGVAVLAAGVVLLAACTRGGLSGGAGAPEPAGSAPVTPPPLDNPRGIVTVLAPDSIPAIDDPKFLAPSDVGFLAPDEPVLAIERNGDARAYPAQILVWHEIVNDTVGGVPVTITYCPLCNTGVGFERPTIDGELLDFGTSGKLYNSNLVMYDRETNSLWPQALGEAITGPLVGTKLKLVPVQLVSWADWKAEHPDGKVLSRDTGSSRNYGTNPYVNYDDPSSRPFLYQGALDPRLQPKARVVGVQIGDTTEAFPYTELQDRAAAGWSAVSEDVAGHRIVVFWKSGTASAVDAASIADSRNVGATGVFSPRLDGRTFTFRATPDGIVDDQTGSAWDIFGRAASGPMAGKQLSLVVSIESFWFDWAAFHPDTKIFGS